MTLSDTCLDEAVTDLEACPYWYNLFIFIKDRNYHEVMLNLPWHSWVRRNYPGYKY